MLATKISVAHSMNILFANHNDFLSNSMGHIAGFADLLSAWGHDCLVAVPFKAETAETLSNPLFVPASFGDVLSGRIRFPNGDPADIVHAWTPREIVRKFVGRYDPEGRARLLVHLEDNEELLLERWAGLSFSELAQKPDRELLKRSTEALSHPRHYRTFLRMADAVTGVTQLLAGFVPQPLPFHLLLPGVDSAAYHTGPADPALRDRLGLKSGERALCYTGSLHHANRGDVRALLLSVQLLNQRGIPTRLVRTGMPASDLVSGLAPGAAKYVIDLGFVAKSTLPDLLRVADILVQPGAPDEFNMFRLPSKVPEFLSVGRPVLLPACNIADGMEDGREALLLRSGTPDEIAVLCARVFSDATLAERLSRNGASFARRVFDGTDNTRGLEALYRTLLANTPSGLRRDTPIAALASLLIRDADASAPVGGLQADLAREIRLSAPADAEMIVPDDTQLLCRVYEPLATGHDDAHSMTRYVRDGRWQRLSFACSGGNPGGQVRIDPADEPCTIEIAGLILRSLLDQTVLWRARGAELDRIALAGTARSAGQGRIFRAYSLGRDPQLLLPSLSDLGVNGPISVEFWMRVSSDLSPLQSDIDEFRKLSRHTVRVPARSFIQSMTRLVRGRVRGLRG